MYAISVSDMIYIIRLKSSKRVTSLISTEFG